jgi:hypothetical protein
VATLAEMYVQGVSTRKVKAITEEPCGHAFSASTFSASKLLLRAPSASPFPISSSTRVMRRCARAASS